MGHRYDSYKRVLERSQIVEAMRMDANETALFARQLEEIDATLYRVQYPENVGQRLVPAKPISPGAAEYTYRAMDYAGQAKRITSYGSDQPRVDVQGFEVTHKMASYGDAYGFSIQDIRAAKFAGLPLENERALAAREVLARKLDEIVAIGDSDAGFTGFTNNGDVDGVSPAVGTWSTADGIEMCQDLFKMERAINEESKGVEEPDTLVLPPSRLALLSTTPVGDNADRTALKFFLENSLFVKSVEKWHRLETAGGSSLPRVMMYKRAPEKLQLLMAVEFETFPPQEKNLEFEILCHMRTGGVIFRYPGSARYMDGT